MNKIVITWLGFFSLLALTYVGIVHLSSYKKEIDMTEHPKSKTVTTKSGLSYVIEKEGSGQKAQKGNLVVVHYTGWLDEKGKPGKQFDSSRDRNAPFSFRLGAGQVIAGWEEGVEGMQRGEKRHLVIPPHLGYGSGFGPIPPQAILHFDVELLDIK
jgi:peptidylprolyl isomerase